MKQSSLPMPIHAIDLARFVDFEPIENGQMMRVAGEYGAERTGVEVGVIRLRRSPGYEVLLGFDDGSIESFSPLGLFPVRPA